MPKTARPVREEPVRPGLPADQAIPRLLEQHGGRIYALGRRLCGGPEGAEDLVQETFLRAFRQWDRFEGRSDPATWLYTIAARACRRMRRRRAGEPSRIASLQELSPFRSRTMPDLPAGAATPLDLSATREVQEAVERAIASLPEAYRLPLVLKDMLELPVADVAEALGLKEGTVKTRVHRARMAVRNRLERALPRRPATPPAYERQVCMDLLRAKMDALDHGRAFPVSQEVVCQRCRAVFASLDLARDACADLASGRLPEPLRRSILGRLEPHPTRRPGRSRAKPRFRRTSET